MFLFCFWQVYPQMLESQSRWQKTFPRIAKGNLKNNTSCLVESLEAQALASPSVAHSCKLGPGNSWLFHNVDIKNLRVFVVFLKQDLAQQNIQTCLLIVTQYSPSKVYLPFDLKLFVTFVFLTFETKITSTEIPLQL